MSDREPCGREPVLVHCHACGHEQRVAWLPMDLGDFAWNLQNLSCNGCGDREGLKLGPRCETVVEAFPHMDDRK